MRQPRSLLLVGFLMIMAVFCWKRCCGLHLWRRRSGRTARAMEPSSTHGQMYGCGVGLITSLIVAVALTAPAAAAAPARVTLAVEALLGGGAHVTATVTDARGSPMGDVAVTLRAKTTFGWLRVAAGTTDRRGQMHAVLPASSRFAEIVAEAGEAETLQAAVRLEQGPMSAPGVRPGRAALAPLSPQPGFISPYPVPVLVLLLSVILGGIWVTYGRVVFLLVQIRRGR